MSVGRERWRILRARKRRLYEQLARFDALKTNTCRYVFLTLTVISPSFVKLAALPTKSCINTRKGSRFMSFHIHQLKSSPALIIGLTHELFLNLQRFSFSGHTALTLATCFRMLFSSQALRLTIIFNKQKRLLGLFLTAHVFGHKASSLVGNLQCRAFEVVFC